jgi:hypothetical protein
MLIEDEYIGAHQKVWEYVLIGLVEGNDKVRWTII